METINFNISHGYGSEKLVELAKSKQSDIYINFAYTDYGGDFFDRIAIAYFKENHPDNIVYENTYFNGENAYIFGEIAKEFKEETDNYLLGFESIEEYYFEKEREMLDALYLFLFEEYNERICTNRDNFIEFLRNNFTNECSYNVMSTMVDYSPSDVEKLLIENNLITSY
jgi:hypothetical protein